MKSFFVHFCAFYFVFNVCGCGRAYGAARKIHLFEEDDCVSWFSIEEERRSSLRKSQTASDTISVGSTDSVIGGDQYISIKDKNGSGSLSGVGQDGDCVRPEGDNQFYNESVNIEFVLPQ